MKKKTMLLIGAGYGVAALLMYSKSEYGGVASELEKTFPPGPTPPPLPPAPAPGTIQAEPGSTWVLRATISPSIPTEALAPFETAFRQGQTAAGNVVNAFQVSPGEDSTKVAANVTYTKGGLIQTGELPFPSPDGTARTLTIEAERKSPAPPPAPSLEEMKAEASREVALNPQPQPPSAVSGTLPKRWTFWYTKQMGESTWRTTKPEVLDDDETWRLQFNTRMKKPGITMYRFVYEPRIASTWIYDSRTDPQLMARAPITGPTYA